MPALLVVADDLTGAADTGVQLAARGIPTLVTLEPVAAWRDAARDIEVLVASTDSRHLPAAEAAARVRDAVSWARDAGVPHVYKKIDSTLRGNPGAELAAALEASGARTLPLVPAHPAMGRTTRDGRVYVHGQPLDRTPFADDPLEPVDDSDIAVVIRRQARVPIAMAAWGEDASPAGGILILDAETGDDLARAGHWIARQGLLAVTAGSGGFAGQLPDLLCLRRSPPEPQGYPERVLVACGSVTGVSLAQTDRAQADGVAAVRIAPDLLMADDPCTGRAADDLVEAVRERERHGSPVLLRTAGDPHDLDACLALGASLGLDRRTTHDRVATNVGRIAGSVLDGVGFDLLVVVGGDTLRAVARALGWRGLRPLRELVPGVPVSAVVGGRGPRLVVSKAGGFGPPDVIARILQALEKGAA